MTNNRRTFKVYDEDGEEIILLCDACSEEMEVFKRFSGVYVVCACADKLIEENEEMIAEKEKIIDEKVEMLDEKYTLINELVLALRNMEDIYSGAMLEIRELKLELQEAKDAED